MCKICVDIQLDKLTALEIAQNFREMSEDDNHWIDVVGEINNKGLIDAVGTALSDITNRKRS